MVGKKEGPIPAGKQIWGPKTKLSYHVNYLIRTQKKVKRKAIVKRRPRRWPKNQRLRRKLFLLSVLKIPYILFHKYGPDTRRKFSREYPCLSKLYTYLLEFIAIELKLPVKCCKKCGIGFLPDYRTGERQKFCPYGCVEANRRENRRKAKKRYRKKLKPRTLAAKHNCLYRQRKKIGQVGVTVPINEKKEKEVIERKLRAQIIFFYYSLYPQTPAKKIEQLDRILQRLSQKMGALYLDAKGIG